MVMGREAVAPQGEMEMKYDENAAIGPLTNLLLHQAFYDLARMISRNKTQQEAPKEEVSKRKGCCVLL